MRAAIEARDDQRIIVYGERVLARQPDDLQILEQVTRALLAGGSKEAWERALKYARRYEELVRQMQKDNARTGCPGPSAAQWRNETDRGMGRALCDEARASGNLGRPEEALALAQRAFETYPNADSARETAHWYERLGKPEEAARRLADAFTIPDPARPMPAGRATAGAWASSIARPKARKTASATWCSRHTTATSR